MTRSEQSEGTLQRILEATGAMVAEQGYEAAGVAEICRAAGVSKGAFYHHFPSKQAVLMALLDAWLIRLEPGLDLWRDDERRAPEVLEAAAAAAAGALADGPRTVRLLVEFWSLAGREPAVAEAARVSYRRYTEGLKALLRRGVREGSMARGHQENDSRVLISLALGVLLSSQLDPSGADWGDVLRRGAALVSRGLSPGV